MSEHLLGDYQVIQPLDKDLIGETVLTEHRFLKKTYALKIFSEEFTKDPSFLERLEEEVAQISLLEHPNIVKLHTVSEAEGRYFLVTDFIEESSQRFIPLSQFLKEKEVSEKKIVHVLKQVASAIDFAHSKHLFHGGLNLTNILVAQKGEDLVVQIADFGLTRIAGIKKYLLKMYTSLYSAFEDEKLLFTLAENFSFLSPEQKWGYSYLTAKIDIYAFGVLTYYLLTKQFPEAVFEMPSKLGVHCEYNWDELILHCLKKDPTQRQSVLTQALESVVSIKHVKPLLKPTEITRPQFDEDPAAIFQQETVIGKYIPEQEQEKEISPLLTEMVIIAGSSFTRGSNGGNRDEMPKHPILLNSFAIDIHPVTNEQFVRFLEALGGEKDAQNNEVIRLRESRIKRFSGHLNIESGYAKHPVVGVTWYGAVAYSKWVGKRLPSEAEWEIAAIGGLKECIYPTGSSIEKIQANFFSSDTTPVMSYSSNGYGLYDMAGNVYEWCHDWYDFHYYDISVQEPKNPKGPLQGVYRVLRGGCWKSLKDDMRCAHRHRNNPGAMNGTYGFRCVADVS